MNKKKIMKKFKNLIPIIIVFLGFFVLCDTAIDTNSQIERLNIEYDKQKIIYNDALEQNEKIKNADELTDEEINKIIVEKAREYGYSYPDEVVFYDINE